MVNPFQVKEEEGEGIGGALAQAQAGVSVLEVEALLGSPKILGGQVLVMPPVLVLEEVQVLVMPPVLVLEEVRVLVILGVFLPVLVHPQRPCLLRVLMTMDRPPTP